YETGPNTGVLNNYEVVDLFNNLLCDSEIAKKESKCRLIYKDKKLHALPSGLIEGIKTPLFSWSDKLNILREPFRSKGCDPNESIAGITRRRLGQSFVNYAVDPFISGIYAGNPEELTTRFALPKLYNLEQNYGSFIKGAIQKSKEPKTEEDKCVTKEVFSVNGGMEKLIMELWHQLFVKYKDYATIHLKSKDVHLTRENEQWVCHFSKSGKETTITSRWVVTTVGSYELKHIIPFVDDQWMKPIEKLRYAPVIQASVGINNENKYIYNAFGALIPSCEKRDILGVLFPSACFSKRTEDNKTLFSVFLGGIKRPELLSYNDFQIEDIVRKELHDV
ncbi:MAG: protoporphyrinogen oxidase, partial [Bacteroidales bacterium]